MDAGYVFVLLVLAVLPFSLVVGALLHHVARARKHRRRFPR